jgi:molybdopterin-guanine dinucleotide biosynthesis protein A
MRFAGITMTDMAAVILVGGKSSRMGRDKATLPYRGKRLADVVAGVAREVGIKDIYVSGEMEGYSSLPDLLAERGPVGGICSSAVKLHQTHASALFIPVDMPRLNTGLLRHFIRAYHEKACHFEDHPLPCILPLDRKTMRHIDATAQTLARKQNVSVRAFLNSVEAETIPVPEHLKPALTNTNTPEEWQEATHESTHQ